MFLQGFFFKQKNLQFINSKTIYHCEDAKYSFSD